jgi:hypothetical protein
MSIYESGRKLGYTNEQIRKIIKEQNKLKAQERDIQQVVDCDNLEDLKILLMYWIEQGKIK